MSAGSYIMVGLLLALLVLCAWLWWRVQRVSAALVTAHSQRYAAEAQAARERIRAEVSSANNKADLFDRLRERRGDGAG